MPNKTVQKILKFDDINGNLCISFERGDRDYEYLEYFIEDLEFWKSLLDQFTYKELVTEASSMCLGLTVVEAIQT